MTGTDTLHDEEVLGKAYDARLMRRLVVYVRPYHAFVFSGLALLFLEGVTQLAGPLLTRWVIDDALPARDARALGVAAALLTLALAIQSLCSYGETMLTSLLGQRVMRDLRMQIFTKLQTLPIAFFDRNPVGRLVTRVTNDVESLNELFTAGVVAGLGDVFTLVIISIMMLLIDWRLALAAFAVIPFVLLTSRLFQTHVRAAYREIRTRLARINAFLQERLTGMRVVQLFGREHREARRFDELNRSHLDAHLRSITVYALYFPVIELLTSVALASLIVAGSARVGVGTLTVGTVAAFLLLVRRFFEPLQDLSDKYNTLQQAMASSERIFALLDTPDGGAKSVHSGALVSPTRAAPVRGEEASYSPVTAHRPKRSPRGVTVAFEDVWFAYDVGHVAARSDGAPPEWVLEGVSFVARPGETIALVGHTGAGKTTIVNLLMRFYDPQRGRITLDGTDIRELSPAELRSRMGYVQQDIFLFAGDIASNIRLSSPLSEAEVVRAVTRVGADRVVQKLPRGYAHVLGERGASVSVGERQLLSFARAIAADPELLLLDEATSAVDSQIEAKIQRALEVLMSGRTTIAVAHRLSTIAGADEIIVLHHGRIVERGTHRTLLAQGGLYERLYRLQTGAFAGADA